MAWKGLHLTRPSRLNFANKQIVVGQDDGEVRLPIEDIAWIILDTPQVSLTGILLAACMEAGVVVISCDAKHTPCGLSLPFHGHFRQPAVAKAQIELSEPLKKRLWQAVIQRKIENQAAVLELTVPSEAAALREMMRWVRSGDPDNVEARAARQGHGGKAQRLTDGRPARIVNEISPDGTDGASVGPDRCGRASPSAELPGVAVSNFLC